MYHEMCEAFSLCLAKLQPDQVDTRLELPCQCKESKSHCEMQPSDQHQCQLLGEDHWMACEPPVGVGVQGNCSSLPWEALQKPCIHGDQSKYFQQLGPG